MMKRLQDRFIPAILFLLLMIGCHGSQVRGLEEEKNILGPQSTLAKGEQHVLMAAVKFPDIEPTFPLEKIRKKAVYDLNEYVKEQSYGLAWVKADFRGWVKLPDPLSTYNVSPYNFKVDRTRVKKLIEDTMTALEKETDFSQYQHLLIIPGTFTMPGKGYGMICYCANPGMLSGVRGDLRYVPLKSKGGQGFRGGVFVGTENAHLGMFAHDFFHALGGIHEKRRLVPCLYNFELQSDASQTPSPEHHAIYMGPWDIMSEHFVKKDQPPPGISSFTKIRLGWIGPEQVLLVKPGETAMTFLSPLSQKGDMLVVKIPLKGSLYYLMENRQPIGFDRNLPDSGLLILKVNLEVAEGSGTVKIMNANPNARHFSQATFRIEQNNRNLYLDRDYKVAILPLWPEKGKMGVLITTPEKSLEAQNAAVMIQKLLSRYPEPRGKEQSQLLEDCLMAFKNFAFKDCIQMVQKALIN
jgi:M6 family metalloprotease-like protein